MEREELEVTKSEEGVEVKEVLNSKRLQSNEVLKSEVVSKSEDTPQVEVHEPNHRPKIEGVGKSDGPKTEVITKTEEIVETVSTCKSEAITDEQLSSENATVSDNLTDDKSHSENIHYEGDVAIYTDPSTKHQFTWCSEKKEWILRNNVVYGFEDDTHTYTDADGSKYFWDHQKNAWFPKLDDEFMARYQLNYGFIDNTTDSKKEPEEERKKEEAAKEVVPQAPKHKLPPPEPTWFDVDDKHNTNVYVSNLPLELTEEEFVNFMQKCGLVMRDPTSGKMKVKLYTDPETKAFKGDALCTFIRVESVDLALKILDGADLKGSRVKVERAKFQMKGEFDPKLKPKKRRKKDKEKFKRSQEKLLDWRPEKLKGERAKHERVVIVRNLFESAMFDENVSLILEYQQDLRDEASKCGEVRKVVLYDRHPEGIAQITMKEPEAAEAVVQLLNGRWFGKRQLMAEIWDGRTKFRIAETDSQISQRLEKWDKFLTEETKNDEIIDGKT